MQLGKKQPCVFLTLAFYKQGSSLPMLGIWQGAPTHPDEDAPGKFYTHSYTWLLRAGGTAEVPSPFSRDQGPKRGDIQHSYTEPVGRTWWEKGLRNQRKAMARVKWSF